MEVAQSARPRGARDGPVPCGRQPVTIASSPRDADSGPVPPTVIPS
jgi:hypothetical protein